MTRFHLTYPTRNRKVGRGAAVSTTSRDSCPTSCPFMGNGCYAEGGPLALHWRAVSDGRAGGSLADFCAAIERLPRGTLFRHNQAGDLPTVPASPSQLDRAALQDIAASVARAEVVGFTYSHHNPYAHDNRLTMREATRAGLVVNVSCETMAQADKARAHGLQAVLTVPASETRESWFTPCGNRVVVCPEQTGRVADCDSCRLCARDCATRAIVAFRVHGPAHRKATAAIAARNEEN